MPGFCLASLMAAVGGLMAASRLLAVNQSSGGGDLLLMAIAGPVVAGMSLFGGRGSVWGALLGALVIVSISNGMDLLALDTSVKFMVTGAVLLGAVASDAVTRGPASSGRGRLVAVTPHSDGLGRPNAIGSSRAGSLSARRPRSRLSSLIFPSPRRLPLSRSRGDIRSG